MTALSLTLKKKKKHQYFSSFIAKMPSSESDSLKEPVLDYSNWADWSEYWCDHLTALDLWQYTNPDTQTALPPPTSNANREIIKQVTENFTKLRQHVSKDCRKLLRGNTTLRHVWIALRAGCDRGTTLPLIAKVEAFHNSKWETKDTISSYISRLRNLYLSLENTDQQINRDLAVHILIGRLPDCYKSEGQAAKQQNLSFVATAAYLLANIKDSSISGDNTSGQALVANESSQASHRGGSRRGGSHRGGFYRGGSHRGGSRLDSRNPYSRDLTCNWCKRRGHKERDCRTKQRQIDSGQARLDNYGRAYLVSPVPSFQPSQHPPRPFAQVPMPSFPATNIQYPQQYPQNQAPAPSPANSIHSLPWEPGEPGSIPQS
jgi:gag-polypeptide of LTR copia-type